MTYIPAVHVLWSKLFSCLVLLLQEPHLKRLHVSLWHTHVYNCALIGQFVCVLHMWPDYKLNLYVYIMSFRLTTLYIEHYDIACKHAYEEHLIYVLP